MPIVGIDRLLRISWFIVGFLHTVRQPEGAWATEGSRGPPATVHEPEIPHVAAAPLGMTPFAFGRTSADRAVALLLRRRRQRLLPLGPKLLDSLVCDLLPQVVAVLAVPHGGVELFHDLLVVLLGEVVQEVAGGAVAVVVVGAVPLPPIT